MVAANHIVMLQFSVKVNSFMMMMNQPSLSLTSDVFTLICDSSIFFLVLVYVEVRRNKVW